MERKTWRRSVDGHEDIGLRDGVGIGDAICDLAAYEDTGLEPDDFKKIFNEDAVLKLAGQALGISPGRLRELAEADKDGRCVMLPCKVGDTVYTIDERYFDCEHCIHGNEARYDEKINERVCDLDSYEGRHCPYEIAEHTVGGFEVSGDENGGIKISDPGEWGYEGLETFYGSTDVKWYLTRSAAEAALEARNGHD